MDEKTKQKNTGGLASENLTVWDRYACSAAAAALGKDERWMTVNQLAQWCSAFADEMVSLRPEHVKAEEFLGDE